MQEVNTEYDRLFKILKDGKAKSLGKILKDQHENNNADSGTADTNFNNMKYDFAEAAEGAKKNRNCSK